MATTCYDGLISSLEREIENKDKTLAEIKHLLSMIIAKIDEVLEDV